MKRLLLIALACVLLLGCAAGAEIRLYVNGVGMYEPAVRFNDSYISVRLECVLAGLGEKCDAPFMMERYRLHDTVLCINFPAYRVYREQSADTNESLLMPTRPGDLTELYDVDWTDHDVWVDQDTLRRVLTAAGVDVQIQIDFEKQTVTIDEINP
jgi:hypothetical protein